MKGQGRAGQLTLVNFIHLGCSTWSRIQLHFSCDGMCMYSTPSDEQYVRFRLARTCRSVMEGLSDPRMSR